VSGSRGGYEVVEGEFHVFDVVDGVSVARHAFFEIEDFHGEGVGGLGGEGGGNAGGGCEG